MTFHRVHARVLYSILIQMSFYNNSIHVVIIVDTLS